MKRIIMICCAVITLFSFVSGQTGLPSAPILISPSPDAFLTLPPISSTSVESTGVTLSWGTITAATSYRIQVATDPTFTAPYLDLSTPTTTATNIGPLNLNTTYYWRVRAANSSGAGEWSLPQKFTNSVSGANNPDISPTQIDQAFFSQIAVPFTNVYFGRVAWGDFDNDGDLDVVVAGDSDGGNGPLTRIYRNDSGTFTDIHASLPGISRGKAIWGDYDHDGDLDLLLDGTFPTGPIAYIKIIRNDGGNFVVAASIPTGSFGAVSWTDYDNDGDLDVLAIGTQYIGPGDTGIEISKIFRNDNGAFVDINANLTGLAECCAQWADVDNDGDLDLFMSGMPQAWNLPVSLLYINDQGSFTQAANAISGFWLSAAEWADYDSDGDLDLAILGQYGSNGQGLLATRIYRNNGGSFSNSNVSLPPLEFGAIAWGDYDNDGDVDLAISGFNGSSMLTRIYRNDGGAFNMLNESISGFYAGSIQWGDYDNDGDVDLLLNGTITSSILPSTQLYRNMASSNTFSVNTIPASPTNLTASITGNQITFKWNKSTDAQTPKNALHYNMRIGTTAGGNEIMGPMANTGTGYRRVVELGNTNQDTQWTVKNLSPGIYYWSVQAIDQAYAGSPFAPEQIAAIGNAISGQKFNDLNGNGIQDAGELGISGWQIALAQSIASPPVPVITTTDAQGNYVFTNLQPSTYIVSEVQQANWQQTFPGGDGTHTVVLSSGQAISDQDFGNHFTQFSDVSATLKGLFHGVAAWGDYDNDGDLDLIVTGITNSTQFVSKIYRNNNGVFTDIQASIVGVNNNHPAVWGDYDNDGDLDLIIAGGTASGNVNCVSKIYRNDAGTFVDIGASLMGLVGSQVWGDYDNDGDLDLIIAGSPDNGSTFFTKLYRNDNGIFNEVPTTLPAVWGASLAWGDYDNDGDLDLALSGYGNQGVTSKIFRNDGSTFVDIDANLTRVNSGALAWGDFDNDGDLDLLFAGDQIGTQAGFSTIYRNDNGVFTDISPGFIGVSVSAAAWGDYDHDTKLDVILSGLTSSNTPITKIYHNDGNGSFSDINAGLDGVWFSAVGWGDYDNDGDLDILLSGATAISGPPLPITKIYRNNLGSNIFSVNTPPTSPFLLASSVNGNNVTLTWNVSTDAQSSQNGLTYNLRMGTALNGIQTVSPMADLASGYRRVVDMGNTNHRNSWKIKGLANGTYHWSVQAIDEAFAGSQFASDHLFVVNVHQDTGTVSVRSITPAEQTINVSPAATIHVVFTGHVNTGSINDVSSCLVTGKNSGRVSGTFTFSGDTALTFTPSVAFRKGELITVDLTKNILALSGSPIIPFFSQFTVGVTSSSGIFDAAVNYPAGGGAHSIFAYDIDGDLDLDMIVASRGDNTVSTLKNNGSGAFAITSSNGTPSPEYAYVYDVDNDGDGDVIATNEFSASFSVFKNNGDGTYAPKVDYATGSLPTSFSVGDIDGDGDGDVVLVNRVSNTLSIYKNNGTGTFASPVSYPTRDWPNSAQISDVNNDGYPDIVVANFNERSVSIFKNNGDGTFAASVEYIASDRPVWVAIGDIDGDGYPDLSVPSFNSDTVAVLKNNGDGTYAPRTIYLVNLSAHSAAVGDIDGDGDNDMVVSNFSSNTVSVFRNNGSGTFGPKTDYAIGTNAYSVLLADVNGDGKLDIVSANGGSNDISVLVNSAGGGGGGSTTPRLFIPLAISDNGPSLSPDNKSNIRTINSSATIDFGVDSLATYCRDAAFGELFLPPPPPPGTFDIRFLDSRGFNAACFDEGLNKDIRRYTTPAQIDTYLVKFQGVYPFTISWPNLITFYSGAVTLKNYNGITPINVNMKATTSVLINDATTNAVLIVAQGPVFPSNAQFRTFSQADYAERANRLGRSPLFKAPTSGNVRDTVFNRMGWKQSGLYLGIPRPDSIHFYSWMLFKNYAPYLKRFLPQTGPAHGFDFYNGLPWRGQRLCPIISAHNNHLAGEQFILKFNIAASDLGVTPNGFGNLTFDDITLSGNPGNGRTIRQIMTHVDSALTFWKAYPAGYFTQLDSCLTRINRAFLGTMNITSSFPLKIAGARLLTDVPYLKIIPGQEPTIIATPVIALDEMPKSFALYQNYPNPFNPTTAISFDLVEPAIVSLRVYNMVGQEVVVLLNAEVLDAGYQSIDFDASALSSGVYFYRLTIEGVTEEGYKTGNNFMDVKKMLLVK